MDLRRSQEWTPEDSWEAVGETGHERRGWLGLDVALDPERSRWAWERFGRETGRIRSWARWEEEGEALTNRQVSECTACR